MRSRELPPCITLSTQEWDYLDSRFIDFCVDVEDIEAPLYWIETEHTVTAIHPYQVAVKDSTFHNRLLLHHGRIDDKGTTVIGLDLVSRQMGVLREYDAHAVDQLSPYAIDAALFSDKGLAGSAEDPANIRIVQQLISSLKNEQTLFDGLMAPGEDEGSES